jgi:alkaline phosphatase D
VLANQVSFAPIDRDTSANVRRFAPDHWDGYVHDRQLILNFLRDRQLDNLVVITGDAHENAVRNVPPDISRLDGVPVATEFVGTSISSDGDPRTIANRTDHDPQNPQLRYFNNQRGYVRVMLDPQRWTNEFRVVSVGTPEATASIAATWMVDNGKPGAYRPEGVVSPV